MRKSSFSCLSFITWLWDFCFIINDVCRKEVNYILYFAWHKISSHCTMLYFGGPKQREGSQGLLLDLTLLSKVDSLARSPEDQNTATQTLKVINTRLLLHFRSDTATMLGHVVWSCRCQAATQKQDFIIYSSFKTHWTYSFPLNCKRLTFIMREGKQIPRDICVSEPDRVSSIPRSIAGICPIFCGTFCGKYKYIRMPSPPTFL